MSTEITAIKQVMAEYCHQVDTGTPAGVAALFHPHATLKPCFDGDYEVSGRAAIDDWYRHYTSEFKAKVRHLKHHIGSEWIRIGDDHATSNCYFLVTYLANHDDRAYLVHGTYTDTLVRNGPQWLFMTRRIDVAFAAPLPNATETFPSLGWPGKS